MWVTLHSGSRGVGNRIGNHYIKVAQDLCRKQAIALPDRDLAYLPEDHPTFAAYMRDLQWAQQFAFHNRNEMMDRVLTEVSVAVYGEDGHEATLEVQRINCHHNFTQKEEHFGRSVWMTRKGAIQAKNDMWAMIPGSMGTRSYIVVGQGAPHELPFRAARRRPPLLAHEGTRAVHHGGPEPGDGRNRISAIDRCCSTRSRPPTRTSTK